MCYYSVTKGSVVGTLYRLVPLQDCTADTLHGTVRNCMQEDGLNIENLIGVGSDMANSMIGHNDSHVTAKK